MRQFLLSSFLFYSLFLVSTPFACAQNYVEYHKLCDQAAKQIEMGMLLPAQGMLMHAFSLVPEPKAIDLFHIAKCWSQNENADSTRFYLDLALAMDPRVGKLTRIHNLWFEPVFGISEWEEIKNSTEKFKSREKTTKEVQIIQELREIDSICYQHRNNYSRFYNEKSTDSVGLANLLKQIELDDSIAMSRFEASVITNPEFTVSHPAIKFALDEVLKTIPIYYFENQKEWFFEQLELGIIEPKLFVDMFHSKYWKMAKKNEQGVLMMEHYFYDDIIDPEETELIEKYGCYPDYKLMKLRYDYEWPYD